MSPDTRAPGVDASLETPGLASDRPSAGLEWLVDARGCAPEPLRDRSRVEACLAAIVADLELKPLAPPFLHVFPDPGGVTGFIALGESHLACHTFPEHGYAAFSLYCCRPRGAWPWRTRLAAFFGAREVDVRSFRRG
jgi:S-adenosylmethionine decarboxylase